MLFLDLVGQSLSTARIIYRQSIVHSIVLCLKRSWNLLFSVKTEKWWFGVVLHHDHVHPHMAAATVKMEWKIKCKFLFCPTYSSDLATSYYHIFRPLEKCVSWTLICKQWRRQGHVVYVAFHMTENILHKWHQEAFRPE